MLKRMDMKLLLNNIDRAMTGTNDNRPDFQRMIKDSFNKKWGYVLVYKFDRFSRDKYQSTLHKHTLKQNGVKVISAMENIPDTPEGIILESLLECMNQYYSAELSQKVKRGLKESRIKGLFKDIDLTDNLACQRLVDMFINKVILYDKYCEIYFNTNGDKSKQLKLKEQPDINSEILFESNKKEQSKLKSSDYSLMCVYNQKSFFDYFSLILRLILIISHFLIYFDFLLFDFAINHLDLKPNCSLYFFVISCIVSVSFIENLLLCSINKSVSNTFT